jgi:hypothetical protein
MSPDLDRMFSALRSDADRAGLSAPDGLRERGDRRTRRRAIAGLVAVAVLAGGVSIGARQLLAGPVAPAPQPAQSPTPTPPPSPSPTAAPTSAEPDPVGSPLSMPAGCDDVMVFPYGGAPLAGQALPASVMLRASDWGKCYAMVGDHAGFPAWERGERPGPRPGLCLDGELYDADKDRVAGRFREFAGGPEVFGYESVTRYRAGGAEAFLAEVRERVARCATYTQPGETEPTWRAQIAERDFTGDESLLVYVGTGTAAEPGYPGWFVGVARVGDLVIVVEPGSDLGGSRAFAKTMTRKAAQRAT